MTTLKLAVLTVIFAFLQALVHATPKYQRIFVNAKAINFVDATKHGFRVVLLDSFLEAHLSPNQIPTLFISAIPLKPGEPLISKVFYPDSIREDKQVNLSELRERSWYYICIEWENFNRHNETTGTDCRLLRTLDRFGKSADTTVEDVEVVDITATTMQFKIRSAADFSMRAIATLQGGNVPQTGSQIFEFHESSDLDVLFTFLKHDTEYGQLCIREEPLTRGYTSMGRYVSGINIEKCYFGKLQTKDYELSTYDMEASPFKRAASSAAAIVGAVNYVNYIVVVLAVYYRWRIISSEALITLITKS